MIDSELQASARPNRATKMAWDLCPYLQKCILVMKLATIFFVDAAIGKSALAQQTCENLKPVALPGVTLLSADDVPEGSAHHFTILVHC
jgi:hypothetical protein